MLIRSAPLRFAVAWFAGALLAAATCAQPLPFPCGDAALLQIAPANLAQGFMPTQKAGPVTAPQPQPSPATEAGQRPPEHRFWDRQNLYLFSAVAASRGLDYSSTLNMRRRGRQEILLTNEVVDNHPAFAAIEVAATAVSIGASYLFHRYHHHRLERWTSIVHASLATTGAVRNYCLQTVHPSSLPGSGTSSTP